MNFRKLIEQAMFELRDEFAVLVAKKLEQLMGDAAPAPRKGRATAGKPSPKPTRAGRKVDGGARRTRTPGTHMLELREKLLSALADGAPRKRAQILEEAGLSTDEATRVATVLKRLKDEGLLTMKGTKASATYMLRAGR